MNIFILLNVAGIKCIADNLKNVVDCNIRRFRFGEIRLSLTTAALIAARIQDTIQDSLHSTSLANWRDSRYTREGCDPVFSQRSCQRPVGSCWFHVREPQMPTMRAYRAFSCNEPSFLSNIRLTYIFLKEEQLKKHLQTKLKPCWIVK